MSPRLSPILAFALFAACADPGKDKAAAVVSEVPKAAEPAPPANTPAAPPVAAPAGPVEEIDALGNVGFTAAKVTRSHEGTFHSWSGKLRLTGDTLTGADITVQIASISTDTPKLDAHLQTPDFFDAAKLPTATFKSTEIRATAPADSKLQGANATVVGDLTMHGVTKRIEVPAVVTVSPKNVVARTEFTINRKDFGIEYPGKPDDLIRDDVVIRADLSGNRTGAATASGSAMGAASPGTPASPSQPAGSSAPPPAAPAGSSAPPAAPR